MGSHKNDQTCGCPSRVYQDENVGNEQSPELAKKKNINLFLGHTAFGNIETNSFAAYSKLSNSIYIISYSFIVGSPVIVFLPRKYKTSVFHFVGSKLFDIPTHRTWHRGMDQYIHQYF
jgi:hypothetical protein